MRDWFIYSLVNLALMAAICFAAFKFCQPQAINTIEKSTTIIYDSTKKIIEPKGPATISTLSFYPVPAAVDTAAILRIFFTVFTHYQQYQDSNIRAEILDTISQNKILGRKFNYQLLRPIKTIESSTVTLNPKGWYGGIFMPISGGRLGIGPKLSYLTERQLLFDAGYDLVNRQFVIGTQIKLNAGSNRKAK